MALFSGVLSLVVAGALSAGSYAWAREDLAREAREELQATSPLLADRIREEWKLHPASLGHEFLPDLDRYLDRIGMAMELRNAQDQVLFRSTSFPRALLYGIEREERLDAADASPLRLRFAMDPAPLKERARRLLAYFGVFSLASTALSVLAGWVVMRRLLAPVEAVRQQAERLSRTSLSERIPEEGTAGEVRELVRTFNAMLTRLETAILDLENFASDAAHELRTPLATLRAEVETAVQAGHTSEEYEAILDSFHVELSRMTRVVTDLFMLAKMDMRQYALQRERVRLLPLLEETLETWQAMAKERRITIRTEGEDAEVMGDAVVLRRVFMNLVENAIKYNRDGGTVTLSIERNGTSVRVRVSDTGIGIPSEHLPNLFRRFYRVDKARSRDRGGAGLGLAICRSFISVHEGKIDVTSRPGEGSTFTVQLPMA